MRQFLYLLVSVFSLSALHGQLPTGQWRVHLPYHNGQRVVSTPTKVYCLADNNLFYYNKQDESINHLSTVQGLSDIDVTSVDYDRVNGILVIGYENGNIDLLDDNGIYNISAIQRKIFPGSKKINNIYIENGIAYLATDFAVVVINLLNKEIKDTYFIGENGSQVKIVDITLDDNYIYALVENGIIRADKNSDFLIDYNEWNKIWERKSDSANYIDIENFNNKLYLLLRFEGYRNDSIYVLNNNRPVKMDLGFDADYYSLKTKGDELIISRTWSAIAVNKDFEVLRILPLRVPKDGDIDEDGTGWVTGLGAGMVKIKGNKPDTITPNGPVNRGAWTFNYHNGTMYVAGGRPNYYWERRGMHYFRDERWHSINGNTDKALQDIGNISKIIVDPLDPDHMFGGSHGYGLVEFRNKKVVNVYDEYNSILEPVEGYEDVEERIFLKVAGLDYDSKGNLFIALSETKQPLYVLTNEGELIHIETKYNGFGKGHINDLLVSSYDHVWVVLRNNGVFALNINGTPDDFSDDEETKFSIVNQDGNSTNDAVSIAEDLDKYIWIGTGSGPVYYTSHKNLFEVNTPVAYQVKLSDFDGLPQYLLGSERINSITIDGANQKWMGTLSSGAYLFSPDGTKEIHHFTKENSPLFTNSISDIGINHKSGEVFFGTEKGIISYRAGATKGISGFGNVYVFPNPVPPGFDGDITITGLAPNVNVKITDISGNLVYETTALGGTALWNGRNFDGKKPATGVYLVFCTNEDGSETFVTKMVFVN